MKIIAIQFFTQLSFLLTVLTLSPALLHSQAATKVFIVRHADRLPADDLSAAGLVRAEELKRVLQLSGIQRIYSTNTVRTTKTAKPLSLSLSVPITNYAAPADVIGLIKNSKQPNHALIVGHSDTVDDLIIQCGCKPPAAITPAMPDTQFDNLFLVILRKITVLKQLKWVCELTHLKYGAVTN